MLDNALFIYNDFYMLPESRQNRYISFREYLDQKYDSLSNRELDVAVLVAQGLTGQEMADKLFLSTKTVKFHCTNVYKKMGVRGRTDLIQLAFTFREFSF